MRVTYYVAASLDGFIAGADGDVSWLDALGIPMDESGYEEFFATVDALVMGRATYEMIEGFGQWPYGDKPTWVCASAAVSALETCRLLAERQPRAVCSAARGAGIDHLWLVGGGRLASAFLEQGLLTHLELSLMPIVLGGGIPLFAETPARSRLNLEAQRAHPSGVLQLSYSLQRSTPEDGAGDGDV